MTTSPEPLGLVLASASPRRQQILRLLGIPFRTQVAATDESPLPAEPPAEMVRRLAMTKALAVAHQNPASTVLAADTVVVFRGQVIGKPADTDEATATLHRLRGRSHVVYTGVALMGGSDGPNFSQVTETRVWMRFYTSQEITEYVASGDPLDKAAAYAIQHPAFRPVKRFEGCPISVMGLPLCVVGRLLTQLGIPIPNHVTRDCAPRHGRCAVAPRLSIPWS